VEVENIFGSKRWKVEKILTRRRRSGGEM